MNAALDSEVVSQKQTPLNILVSALAKLQDVSRKSGLHHSYGFNFPRIVVIGNQSCGKSSIVEAIVGKEFLPRGTDIVTRCPTYVRLHQTEKGSQEYAVFAKQDDDSLKQSEKITNFSNVCQEIERRTQIIAGSSKGISHTEICIDIYSPNYPDLQFVDLPGFTKTPVHGQPNDIEQQILDMNLRYMKDENTIILAIQDATQDIGASEALKHALIAPHAVDPEGKRTIGVLTKLDKLEEGSDTDRAIDILENRTKPLKLGYIGVVNRTQNQVDRHINIESAKQNEREVMAKSKFSRIRCKMGTDYLRQYLTMILARKMKQMMPGLKDGCVDDLQRINEDLLTLGYANDENVDYDDLISELVEKTVDKIRISLQGMDSGVDTTTMGLGAKMNEKVKEGSVVSSRKARKAYSVDKFYSEMKVGIQNTHAIRDHILPVETALELGVGILTENYRRPYKRLLDESKNTMNDDLRSIIEETLGAYPKFQDLVTNLFMEELETNKVKAEDYLDVIIDMHKRFVNSEHVEFKKMRKLKKGMGIRFKNNFNLWFQEEIASDPSDSNQGDDDEFQDANGAEANENQSESGGESGIDVAAENITNIVDTVSPAVVGPTNAGLISSGIQAVRGFVDRIQRGNASTSRDGIHTNRLPSNRDDEAMFHLDLCLEYMEIVDKQIVDEIPKIFIMMLVHKTLDFLNGGKSYPTSILREVQKKCREVDVKEDVLTKSTTHQEKINELVERRRICEETIKVIDETGTQLNLCT